jgi:hypothetical protein
MKPEVEKQLQSVLDTRDKQRQEAATLAANRQSNEAKNLADFAAKKDEVIRPAFEEIVKIYKARNLPIRIQEKDETQNSKGGTEAPVIALDLAPNTYNATMKPQFQFTFDKRNRELSLYTSTSSQAGPGPKIALDAVSIDWIHEAFVKYETKGSLLF